nr:hypothetical protein BaRGS_007233 [Batillaria attramentaria]
MLGYTSGRPKPSIRVVRVDTGRPLERYTTRRSGQDENVQQYTLTTSARCQDAAIYRCEASNRVGSDEENVTLFVNCAPNLVDDNSLGNLERPLILNKSLEQRESARASLHLLVYPSPSLLHVAYVVLNEKVLDAGFYRLTVGNVAGDFSFYVKLNVHAVTEKVWSCISKLRS